MLSGIVAKNITTQVLGTGVVVTDFVMADGQISVFTLFGQVACIFFRANVAQIS